MTYKQQQFKIAVILYDLGLDIELIEAMTSLNKEELKKLYARPSDSLVKNIKAQFAF